MKRLTIMFYYLILVIVVAACTKDELHEPVNQKGIENQNAAYQGDFDHNQVQDDMESKANDIR